MNSSYKRSCVLWSGGLDSTYLIYKLLEEGKSVRGVYIDYLNNRVKGEQEKQAIKKLTTEFQKNENYQFEFEEISRLEILGTPTYFSLPMIPGFVMSMMYQANAYNDINIGYVMNDDAISYLNEIQELVESFSKFSFNSMPEIKFPLSKIKKNEIIKSLPIQYLKHIVYCETPSQDISDESPVKEAANIPIQLVLTDPSLIPLKTTEKEKIFTPCGKCIPCKKYINDGYQELINQKLEREK